jgi:hypothetical protein
MFWFLYVSNSVSVPFVSSEKHLRSDITGTLDQNNNMGWHLQVSEINIT